MASPEGLFAALLAVAPAQPFVTYYGDGSHDRAELSARSLANWIAKTYFLLTDELGLGRGNTAYIDLPAHWISVRSVTRLLDGRPRGRDRSHPR